MLNTQTPVQVVALSAKDFVNPEMAVIHAPIALLPVAFPKDRFLQVKFSSTERLIQGEAAGPMRVMILQMFSAKRHFVCHCVLLLCPASQSSMFVYHAVNALP